jgi:hypothetical protein
MGQYPNRALSQPGIVFTATSKKNINLEITYEYEYGITAGG